MRNLIWVGALWLWCMPAWAGSPSGFFSRDDCSPAVRIWQFKGNRRETSVRAALPSGKTEGQLQFRGATWLYDLRTSAVADRPDAMDVWLRVRLLAGDATEIGVSLDLEFDQWSVDNYVLLPGAVYHGNRFRAIAKPYRDKTIDREDYRLDLPITTRELPRLNIADGESRIEEHSGNLSTPAVGVHLKAARRGFLLLTEQANRLGNFGLVVEESLDRTKAVIRIATPSVREKRPTSSGLVPSNDRAADWKPGDEVTLAARLFFFDAPVLQGLFDRFLAVRKDRNKPAVARHLLPLSETWSILEEKLNSQNWVEKAGLYMQLRAWVPTIFELGWVGGCQNTQALLCSESELSRQRAWQNLDTVLRHAQAPSGFFYGAGDGERWGPGQEGRGLVRKNADVLYSFLKQFRLMQKLGQPVPAEWEVAVRKQADAFVKLWNKRRQFGQWIDVHSGDILVGATTSAAIAPAGLALASEYFRNPEYLEVAEKSARLFYDRDVKAGVTTGGPGDALQAPDYESAYSLIESFIVLYEMTGKRAWLAAAEEQGCQFATWVVSYDYEWPPASTFGKLGMQTTGTMWANAQNKCAVPGICTASGDAYLKLYRATGKTVYLELLKDIVHAIPQYLSRADRPIPSRNRGKPDALEPGWIWERVQMGDWETPNIPVGEIHHNTASWAQTALMLTWIEVPGLYVQPDTGVVASLDHIDARLLSRAGGQVKVRLRNPTAFPARVRTVVESSVAAKQPLGFNALMDRPVISLAAGEQKDLVFDENGFAPAGERRRP